MSTSPLPIHVIGGGLAGSEAAWQIASAGVPVVLHEMRPVRQTEAHQTDGLAEMVCSNSFRSDDAEYNAVGLLHEEMRRCDSLILRCADAHKVPAGGALAVDRDAFSAAVSDTLARHPLVTLVREEVAGLPPEDWDSVIVATGPLTSPALAEAVRDLTGEESLAFFDAIAPIVYTESIDLSKAWFQSRYDKPGPGGTGQDYINCAMDKDQYTAFIQALIDAPKTDFKEWEKNTPYFEGCLPIEVMASRGIDTLRYGPMKPVGLTNPHTGGRSHAIVQLRQDNALGTLYNLVGFQTKMKYADQTRVFRMIPGLENAEFARLGGHAPQHLPEQPEAAGPRVAPEGHAAPALRRSGDRRGGLCGVRRHRPADGTVRGGRAGRTAIGYPASHHGAWRPAEPHHRRGRSRDLPADERQFRPVPRSGRQDQGPRPQAGLYAAGTGGPRRLAGHRQAAE